MRSSSQSAPSDGLTRHQVAMARLILTGSIGLSAVLGVLRNTLFAAIFGASASTSAYIMAFTVPDLVNYLVGGGVIVSATVPYLTRKLEEGQDQEAWQTFRALFTFMMVFLAVIILLAEVFTGPLVRLLLPTYRLEDQVLCALLMRIILPAQFFFVAGGLFMGGLHTFRHFTIPAMGPIIYNLSVITGIVWLGPRMGLLGPAVAVPVGAFLGQMVLQVPLLASKGVRLGVDWRFSHPDLQKIIRFMVPVTLSLSAVHISAMLSRYLAGRLDVLEGKGPTYFEWAYRLMMFPVLMFGSATGMALFPALSQAAARRDFEACGRILGREFRNVLFLCLPFSALFVAAAGPITTALFRHGNYTAHDAQMTAGAVTFYSMGLVGLAGQQVIVRGFYALWDPITPIKITILQVIVGVAAAWALAFPMGLGLNGIALGTSVAALSGLIAMGIVLSFRIGNIDWAKVLDTLLRVAPAAALAGLAAYAVTPALAADFFHLSGPGRVAGGAVVTIAALAAYAVAIWLFRIEEGQYFFSTLLRRSARRLTDDGPGVTGEGRGASDEW